MNKGIIQIPDFQRELQLDKIESIIHTFQELHKQDENYFIKHGYTLSLCKLGIKKELYLIDGQHRLEAIKTLFEQGYNPEILIRIQLCSSITQMKNDFKLLNSNSNIPIIYTLFEDEFVQNILIELKNLLKKEYFSSFNRKKTEFGKSNRYHLDSFIELFDIEKIKELYLQNCIDSGILFNKLLDINKIIKNKFDNFDLLEKKFYINGQDLKIISSTEFYISLSNINWLDKFYDDQLDITLNPIKYKKVKIPKSLSKKIYDRDIGDRNYIGKCFVCETEINRDSAQVGHIKPEYNGGETNLENLKAICSTCNLSMGTSNMIEYKTTYFQSI